MPQFARQTNKTVQTAGGGIQSGLKALRGKEISGQIDTLRTQMALGAVSNYLGLENVQAEKLLKSSGAWYQFKSPTP